MQSTNTAKDLLKLDEEIKKMKLDNLKKIVELLVKFDCCDEECVSIIKNHTHNLLVEHINIT
jgi:hypothetical protein